jgi:signal transduction histidine kinase
VRSLAQYVDYLNLVLYTTVALVAIYQLREGRGRAALWAALTFGALALVVDSGRIIPDEPTTDFEFVARRTLIAVLVVFPFLLYRFTTAFRPPPRELERFLGLMTIALVVWTFLLPDIPGDGEPRPGWFYAYLVAFLVHWTVLTIVVAARLWRAGRGQPGVARRRMEMFAFGATVLTVALLLAVFAADEGSALDVAVSLLATASALTFLLGLAPPAFLRTIWRRPEQRRVQDAIADLMSATTPAEIAHRVLPPMADIVGARAVALRSTEGELLGTHGATDEMLVEAEAADGPVRRCEDGSNIVVLDVPSGALLVWTSPYAPFFGGDEMQLLRTLGALTGLALDRARLFTQEQDAREALERADEIKTNFIALAAHELRTPVATVHGVIETMHMRSALLSPQQRTMLEETLRQQSKRMRTLVDQLLDLSRLDAEAVTIAPERFAVRERVEELVAAAAAERAPEVSVEVAEDLEASVDPAAFDRVVTNLIVNAFRYGEPPVTVRAEQRDRHFRLTVEDRGPGVAPEFVPELFERFTRSGGGRARGGGTGLGLAIARSYATAHRGDLIYEHVEPHGARFQLVLPRDLPTAKNGNPS